MARPGQRSLLRGRRPRAEERPELTDTARARNAALARLAAVVTDGWEDRAECVIRRIDPEAFFPAVGQPISAAALSACSGCQVRAQCLRRAMRLERSKSDGGPGRFGIYGGLTAGQRTELAAGRKVRMLPASARNRDRAGVRAAAATAKAARSAKPAPRRLPVAR